MKTVDLFYIVWRIGDAQLGDDSAVIELLDIYTALNEQGKPIPAPLLTWHREADTYVYDNEDMRNIFNLGHTKKGAYVLRCAPNTHEVEEFYAYAPMAIGQIKLPPDTILDRCITVLMKRKKANERVKTFDPDNSFTSKQLETIQAKLIRWTQDNEADLRTHRATLPPMLQNRTADKWTPLFILAELAGGA